MSALRSATLTCAISALKWPAFGRALSAQLAAFGAG
jgi:hypothetical protein